jgi:hypothetical protein
MINSLINRRLVRLLFSMTPALASLPVTPRRILRRNRTRVRQRSLFCACGQGIPAIAGLCRPCYRARAHSRARFGGHREAILERDGRLCGICGAGKAGRGLHVHHRKPGCHDPHWLVAVCAACHARIHRLLALRAWLPARLIELWAEQHPNTPVQLQLPLADPGGMSLAA